MVNYHARSPALLAQGRQISGYPPASGSRTTLTWIPPCHLVFVTSSLSPHLARFFARFFAGCPCFRLAGSLTVGIVNEKTF